MKLSICCITYNHEAFIAQAIDSFLMQQTNFDVEIVIHDDASTDGTAAIVAEYAARYPHKIRATLHSHNSGMMQNFANCLSDCRGQYLALCEGDDYWIDSLKLQQQVDFLEQHPAYVITWTQGTKKLETTQELVRHAVAPPASSVSISQLLRGNPFLTASCVFRRSAVMPLPSWFVQLPFGDYGLYILALYQSKKTGYVMDINSCVYRIHSGGVHSRLHNSVAGRHRVYEQHTSFFSLLDSQLLHGKYDEPIALTLKELALYLKIEVAPKMNTGKAKWQLLFTRLLTFFK